MARLPPPVTMITCSMPLAIASSTPYWMVGLSTRGSISFGCALGTGRNRVPRPAAGKIAFRTAASVIEDNLSRGRTGRYPARDRRAPRTRGGGRAHHPPRRWGRHLRHARDDRPHGDHRPPVRRARATRGTHL